MLRCWLILGLLLLHCTAQAAATDQLDIGKRWMLTPEPGNALSLEDAEILPLVWEPSRWAAPNLGFESAVYWLRFDVAPQELTSGYWRLWIHNSLLADVTFYVLENGKLISTQRDGLWLPYEKRASAFRYPAFGVNLISDKHYRFYLRVRSETALQVPAELVSEAYFVAQKETNDLMLGVFLGVLLAMMVYNLWLFVAVKDLSFLLYVGHVSALVFFVVSWQGLGATYLWPGLIGLQSFSIALATFLVIGFSTWFCLAFLELNRQNFALYNLFIAVRNMGFAGVLVTPFLPVQWAIIGSSVLSFPAVVLVVKAIIDRASLKHRPTLLFALGWATYVTGALMMGLNKVGLIEVTGASENMLLWASVFDMVLLCIALGDRFHYQRRIRIENQSRVLAETEQQVQEVQARLQREQAAQKALGFAIAGQEDCTRQLEFRVRDRARELVQLKQQLETASECDGLTGLKNRRFFTDRLMDEISRNSQIQSRFCVLVIDIDRFRVINETHGHMAADECLCQVGDILQQQLKRPTDILCRIGGEQFGILLPETSADGAMRLAEQMRVKVAECPMLCAGLRIMATVSIGVIEAGSRSPARPETVLHHVDSALLRAKADGRNCVALAG